MPARGGRRTNRYDHPKRVSDDDLLVEVQGLPERAVLDLVGLCLAVATLLQVQREPQSDEDGDLREEATVRFGDLAEPVVEPDGACGVLGEHTLEQSVEIVGQVGVEQRRGAGLQSVLLVDLRCRYDVCVFHHIYQYSLYSQVHNGEK